MSALQGNFTHPQTKAQSASAYLLLDDVVVSLASQIAAIHYSVYVSKTAQQAGATPVYSDHDEAMAPVFSEISLPGLDAGSLDAQIRQAAYQWLQGQAEFNGWTIVA